MRKVHNSKHKFNPNSASDEEAKRKLYKTESLSHHHKKKLKKHKHKEKSLEYANSKNSNNQSPLRNKKDEIIEVHGSSSDDSNNCDYQNKHSDGYVGTYRCRHHRKKERKHKKRRKRSKSLSKDRTEEYSKNDYRKLREEERSVKSVLDSNTEFHYGSSHKKKVLVEKIESESREGDRDSKKLVERNRSNIDEKFRNKPECEDNGTIMIKKEQLESETNKNSHEGSSESRNNFRKRSGKRDAHEWGCSASKKSKPVKSPQETQKPNFELSGKLAEDTNIYNGVVIKYSEPPEARMPKKRWRLYPFKGDQPLPPLYIHRQSAYLLGRDRKVVDMPIDHPSCSKQHAALQYRLISYERANGSIGKQIRLYIIDLDSANGTFINNKKIESRKYVELFEKDVIKFGFSSREYVLLHEHSKDDDQSPNDTQLD